MVTMVAALYRRYRPESFAEMIGQRQVTDPLATAIRSGRINHAYLFSGPRGCGKTTSARILARCLNCAEGPTPEPCGVCDSCRELGRDGGGSLDVLEIDAASHGGVEDARDLRERAVMAPSRDRYRIFIIDEAHMVTGAGFNALLKVVEEPPEDVLFIFATTEPEKVIGTIRSRTHHYPFRLIPPAPMLEYVEQICREEQVSAQPGVLPLVVRAGGGSARDTMSLLDQLIAGTDGREIQYDRATQLLGFTAQELLDDTVLAFADGNADAAYRAIDAVIQSGQDPRRFVEDLLERVRDLIVAKAVGDGAEAVLRGRGQDELSRLIDAAARFSGGALSAIADAVNTTLTEMTGVTAPKLQLELMVARILVALRSSFAGGGVDAPGHAGASAASGPDTPTAPGAGREKRGTSPSAAAAAAESVSAPTATVAPTETAAAADTAGGTTTPSATGEPPKIEQIRDAWPTVLERVLAEGGRTAWTVVDQLQPLDYDGDVLRVEVPNPAISQQLRHSQDGRPPAGQLLKSALQATFGIAMRVQPRVRIDNDATSRGGGAAAADDDHHRAGRTGRAGTGERPDAGAGGAGANGGPDAGEHAAPAPAGVTRRNDTPETAVNWTVAAIPGEEPAADDGPGSAWDEYASPLPDDRADSATPTPPRSDATEVPDVAPPEEERIPEVIAAREAAAMDEATTPQPVELPSGIATVTNPAAVTRPEAEPAAERFAADHATQRADAVRGAAGEVRETASGSGTDAAGGTRPDASGWNVASLPDDRPAVDPEPEPEPEPEAPRRHPALVAGQERYGESVVRERLGARFVGEEAIAVTGPTSDLDAMTPPDDFEAPPEEY